MLDVVHCFYTKRVSMVDGRDHDFCMRGFRKSFNGLQFQQLRDVNMWEQNFD